jgi:ABC-2 type transport system permease protein
MISFSPRRLLAVARKESQDMVRNWMSLLLSVIAPVVLYFLFAFGLPLEIQNVPAAVLDLDRSTDSRRLIQAFENSKRFVVKKMLNRYEDINRTMCFEEIRACIVIPKDFSKYLSKAQLQRMQVITDGTNTSRAEIIASYVESTVLDFSGQKINAYLRGLFGPSAKDEGMPLRFFTNAWFNPTLRSEDFIVPGVIGIILVFLPPIISAIALSKEKESGSVINMFCSPVTKTEFILGKAVPYVIVTFFNFILFYIFTRVICEVPMRGSLLLFFGSSLLYCVTIIGAGLFIAVLMRNQISAILVCAVGLLIPSFQFSGFIGPLMCMEEGTRAISNILPSTHFIDLTRKLMVKGAELVFVQNDITTLLGMSIFFYGFSILIFKKRLT